MDTLFARCMETKLGWFFLTVEVLVEGPPFPSFTCVLGLLFVNARRKATVCAGDREGRLKSSSVLSGLLSGIVPDSTGPSLLIPSKAVVFRSSSHHVPVVDGTLSQKTLRKAFEAARVAAWRKPPGGGGGGGARTPPGGGGGGGGGFAPIRTGGQGGRGGVPAIRTGGGGGAGIVPISRGGGCGGTLTPFPTLSGTAGGSSVGCLGMDSFLSGVSSVRPTPWNESISRMRILAVALFIFSCETSATPIDCKTLTARSALCWSNVFLASYSGWSGCSGWVLLSGTTGVGCGIFVSTEE